MSSDAGRKRLAMAVAITVALVAAVPIADGIFRIMSSSPAQAVADEGIRAARIVDKGNADETLNRIEELAEDGEAQLPAYFEEEIGLPDGTHDVRVDDTGRVVGFIVDGPSREVFACICENMAKAGWSAVSLGEAEGATFVKEGGLCTWALVTCTQAGSATAVVYRCVAK